MSAGRAKALGPQARKKFYAGAVTEAERDRLAVARTMEGLDEEIALLRVKLFSAVNENQTDLRLMKVGMDALVRAVAAQYRMSPKAERDLSESMAAVIRGIGDQLVSPDR